MLSKKFGWNVRNLRRETLEKVRRWSLEITENWKNKVCAVDMQRESDHADRSEFIHSTLSHKQEGLIRSM